MGVFLDPRSIGNPSNHKRNLIKLSDGYRVLLDNLNHKGDPNVIYDTIFFYKGGTPLGRRILPGRLQLKKANWSHIGFQFSKGNLPDIYIDGMLVGKPAVFTGKGSDLKSFFTLRAGTKITLGSDDESTKDGIKGWVDDFKVIARAPTMEENCNYARGTIVKVSKDVTFWWNRSQTYPEFVHSQLASASGEPSGSRFACYAQYGKNAMEKITSVERFAHLKNIPQGTKSVRNALTHERRYLKFGKPRPDFSSNKFCLSCHVDAREFPYNELNTNALTKKDQFNVENDPRRQPSQPKRMIHGIIPANYFGSGQPARRLTPPHAHDIDKWVLD